MSRGQQPSDFARAFIFVAVAFAAACIAGCADASAQQPAPSPTPSQTDAPDTSSSTDALPDISITGRVTARELKFNVVPNPKVEFTGRPRRETVWKADRENLPPAVRPGETYRNIGITLRITSVFADIERIVAEALGEIPLSDETPQEERTPSQQTPSQQTPPQQRQAAPTPPAPMSSDASATSTPKRAPRRAPARRGTRR